MPAVLFETIEKGIGLITLNRPERLNAITAEWISDILAVFDRLHEDRDTRVVLITGAGRGFCAGFDLKQDFNYDSPDVAPIVVKFDWQERLALVTERMIRLRQPTIAAIHGPAAGGGLAVALAADMRVAGYSANFHVANARIGLSAGDCGISWLFPRLIGLSRSMEVLLTGRPFDAAEADRMGLLSRLVEDEHMMDEALGIARAIAANPPFGVRMSKEVIYANLAASDIYAASQLEKRTQILCGETGEVEKAINAFRRNGTPTSK